MSKINVAPKHGQEARGKLLATAAGTLIALALSTGGAAAGSYTTVSSSGQEFAASISLTTESEPFGGVSDPSAAEAVGPLSADELEAMLELKPAVSPADDSGNTVGINDAQESIIGPDNRTRIFTTTYPASAVALIRFENSRCTGFMISEDTVATAGHCVHEGNGGQFFDLDSFRIAPGFDRDTPHFGECGAKELLTVTGWTDQGDERFDLAAIKLDCTVGDQTGWFGLRANAGQNETAIVTGYPGDKPLEMWQAVDRVRRTESRQLHYATDTIGGNSGGPVWNDFQTADGSQGPYAIAIHAYGISGPGDLNKGTRLTDDVMAFLIDAINTP